MPSDVHTHTVLLDFTRCYVAHFAPEWLKIIHMFYVDPDGYQHIFICCYSWDTCNSGHMSGHHHIATTKLVHEAYSAPASQQAKARQLQLWLTNCWL